MKFEKLFFIAFIAFLFASCSEQNIAGGVSEETNAIAGILLDKDGAPSARTLVKAKHFEVDSIEFFDTTDIAGSFNFSLSKQGFYGISAEKDSLAFYETIQYTGTEIQLKTSLKSIKNVKAQIELRDSLKTLEVYVPGSPWRTFTDSLGFFSLHLPAGKYSIIVKSPNPLIYSNAEYLLNVEDDIEIEEKWTLPLQAEFGIKSWWNMDFVDGNIVRDLRGSADGILLYGTPQLEESVSGNALVFKNATQYGVIENDNSLFDELTAMVLETWIFIDSLPEENVYQKNLIGKLGFGASDDQNLFSLAIEKNSCTDDSLAHFAFFLGEENSFSCQNAVIDANEIPLNQWLYVAILWNEGRLKLLINGELRSEKTLDFTHLGISREPLFIGKENIGFKIDDLKIGVKAIENGDVLYRYLKRVGAK